MFHYLAQFATKEAVEYCLLENPILTKYLLDATGRDISGKRVHLLLLPDFFGETPLDQARKAGNPEIVKILEDFRLNRELVHVLQKVDCPENMAVFQQIVAENDLDFAKFSINAILERILAELIFRLAAAGEVDMLKWLYMTRAR